MAHQAKILIVGHGRHGKDTMAEYLQDNYGLTYNSSSEFCSENVVFPVLKNLYGYKTHEEAFADRHNHRAEWYDLISGYCKNDPSRLGKEIFRVSDIYCGLRNKREFHSLRNQCVFDYSVWVDRSDHLPPEPKESNSIEQWMCDYTIDNNADLQELYNNIDDFANNRFYKSEEWPF